MPQRLRRRNFTFARDTVGYYEARNAHFRQVVAPLRHVYVHFGFRGFGQHAVAACRNPPLVKVSPFAYDSLNCCQRCRLKPHISSGYQSSFSSLPRSDTHPCGCLNPCTSRFKGNDKRPDECAERNATFRSTAAYILA